MLKMAHVTKKYHRADTALIVLDSFSHEFHPGRLHLVCGASGSGKSTLLMIAGSLMKPDAGQVVFCGQDLYAGSVAERNRFRNRHLGFIFQGFHLVPHLNVRRNILLPLTFRKDTVGRERAVRIIAALGLDDRLDHRPGELSVGQAQRVAVARALAGDPGLVLADEPTGNLDAHNAAIIVRALKAEADAGKIVIVATHDPAMMAVGHEVINLDCHPAERR